MMIMLPRPRHRHRVHGAPGTAAHGNGGPRRVAANAAPPSSPRGSRAQPGRRRSGACTAAASSSTVIATASATAISSTAAFPYEDWLREAGDGMDILPHPLFGPSAYARRAFKAGEVVLHERPLLVVPSPPEPLIAACHALMEEQHGLPPLPAALLAGGSKLPERYLHGRVARFLAWWLAPPAVRDGVLRGMHSWPGDGAGDSVAVLRSEWAAAAIAARLLPSLPGLAQRHAGGDDAVNVSVHAVGAVDEGTVARVLLAWTMNAHGFGRLRSAVFLLGSKLPHTCGPPNTTYHSFPPAGGPPRDDEQQAQPAQPQAPGQKVAAEAASAYDRRQHEQLQPQQHGLHIAMRDIAAGELLTTSYLAPEQYLMPTPARQRFLRQNFGFDCACERCTAEADDMRGLPCPRCVPRDNLGLLPAELLLLTRRGRNHAGGEHSSSNDASGQPAVASASGGGVLAFHRGGAPHQHPDGNGDSSSGGGNGGSGGSAGAEHWRCGSCGCRLPNEDVALFGRAWPAFGALFGGQGADGGQQGQGSTAGHAAATPTSSSGSSGGGGSGSGSTWEAGLPQSMRMAGAGDVEAHMQRLVSASAAAAGDGSRPEASGLLARVGRVLGPHHYTYNAAVLTDTGFVRERLWCAAHKAPRGAAHLPAVEACLDLLEAEWRSVWGWMGGRESLRRIGPSYLVHERLLHDAGDLLDCRDFLARKLAALQARQSKQRQQQDAQQQDVRQQEQQQRERQEQHHLGLTALAWRLHGLAGLLLGWAEPTVAVFRLWQTPEPARVVLQADELQQRARQLPPGLPELPSQAAASASGLE